MAANGTGSAHEEPEVRGQDALEEDTKVLFVNEMLPGPRMFAFDYEETDKGTVSGDSTGEAGSQEKDAEEETPRVSWRHLAYLFTQDTTMHGVRFVTRATHYQLRRVLWFLMVTASIGALFYLNSLNVIKYFDYPKSVNLEVTYQNVLSFPAVTVCNYNPLRLSGLSEVGLYEAIWEQYNGYGNTDGNCKDTYTYVGGFCFHSMANLTLFAARVWVASGFRISATYEAISELACEEICSHQYSSTCSAVVYNRMAKRCTLTETVFEPWLYGTSEPCSLDDLEYYRRLRCPVIGPVSCDFERGAGPPNSTHSCALENVTMGTDETWLTSAASLQHHPTADHSMGGRLARGHFLHLPETDKRPGFRASLQFPFMAFNESCLELFYVFLGNASTTLNVSVVSENNEEVVVSRPAYNNSNGHDDWNRLFLRLPDGFFKVTITGERSSDPGLTGVAIDDVTIWPCQQYYSECKRTPMGTEYIGTMKKTADDLDCMFWDDLRNGAVAYTADKFPDPTLEEASNFCRNPSRAGDSPWCYRADQGSPKTCSILFCECNDDQFRCSDGFCIPMEYLCNGVGDCSDRSDESAQACPALQSALCDFEDAYSCGYFDSGITALSWQRYNALGLTDRIAPAEDSQGSVLDHFMLASTVRGIEGDVAALNSPRQTIPAGFCISMDLYLVLSEFSTESAFRVIARPALINHVVLHDVRSWEHEGWRRVTFPLVEGYYSVGVAFRMGFPYTCTAAIDNVHIAECLDPEDGTMVTKFAVVPAINMESTVDCSFTGGDKCDYQDIYTNSRARWKLLPSRFFDLSIDQAAVPENAAPGLSNCPLHTVSRGKFDSHFYPTAYTNNYTECLGHIQGPPGSKVRLDFHKFDLGRHDDKECDQDRVEIFEGTRSAYNICNAVYDPARVFELGSDVYVVLVTDSSGSGAGCRVVYSITSLPGEDYLMYLKYAGQISDTNYMATLYSPLLEIDVPSCLAFDYNSASRLTVTTTGNKSETLFVDDAATGTWNRIRLDIPSGHYEINFKADFYGVKKGFKLALDDIKVSPFVCSDTVMRSSLDCDFSSIEQCGYYDDSGARDEAYITRWTRGATQLTNETSPDDPNYYMACMFPSIYRTSRAILSSRNAEVQGPSCLTFLYWMSHDQVQLRITTTTHGRIAAGHPYPGPGWQRAAANLTEGTYRLWFTVRANGGTIAVSNISVALGACAPDAAPNRPTHVDSPGGGSRDGSESDDGESSTTRSPTSGVSSTPASRIPEPDHNPPLPGHHRPMTVMRPRLTGGRLIKDVVTIAGHQRDDFITSCHWLGEECSPDMIADTLTESGFCYTFNPGTMLPTLHTSKQGSKYGLQLVLNIEQYEHMDGVSVDAGVKVHLHDQDDVPNVRDLGASAALSTHTGIAVKYVESKSLPSPHGTCGETPLELFAQNNYTRARCTLECQARELFETCGCMLYYMPGDSYPQCTTNQYLECVLDPENRFAEADCTECTNACNVVSFELEPSYSGLSSLGVNQLLTTSVAKLTKKYHSVLKRKERMSPDIFLETTSRIDVIATNLRDMINFARIKTDLGPTSEYTVIRESLNFFITMVNTDVRLAFHDLPAYSEAYRELFNWNHQANLGLIDVALHDIAYLSQQVQWYSTHPDLIEQGPGLDLVTRRLFKSLRNVFRHLGLLHSIQWNQVGTPAFYMSTGVMANFTPDTIFETELVQTTCTEELNFDFENQMRYIDESSNATYLLDIAAQLPFGSIIAMLEHNHVVYQNCISNYSLFLKELNDWFDTFSLAEVGANSGFIFDLNAVEVLSDDEWFTETVIEKYKSAEMSKLDLANAIDADRVASITANVDAFRSALHERFTQALGAITDQVRAEYEEIYGQALRFLDTFQRYFPTRQGRYWTRAREMVVWRIPAAHLAGAELVEFQLRPEEIWKTWPEYMNLASFSEGQMQNVFHEITHDFFDEVKSALHSVDLVLQHYASDIKKELDVLSEDLQIYKETTMVDETFILNNFLALDVYYGELIYKLIEQQPAYGLMDAFSDMGGLLGLLIGASVMTVCELFDMFIYNTLVKWCSGRK